MFIFSYHKGDIGETGRGGLQGVTGEKVNISILNISRLLVTIMRGVFQSTIMDPSPRTKELTIFNY